GAALRLDDLAVVLRCLAQGTWPGVSIDPDPLDPHGPFMHYRYIGPTERTHTGHVMGNSDRWMKVLGMGEDNEKPQVKVRPQIEGFLDQFEHVMARKDWLG